MDDDLIIRAILRDEVGGPAKNVRREIRGIAEDATVMGKAGVAGGKGLDATTGASIRQRAALRQLDGDLRTVSGSLSSALVSGARRGALALGVITGAAAAFGLKASSQFQQSRIAFGALLGDVAKGNALFAQLQQINLKTPFELNEIAPATQLLLRYGVAAGQVVPVLKSLLDAAALTNDPQGNLQAAALAVGQIVSSGRILGQDANQLTQAGIPVYELFAEKLGITALEARKLGEAGKLSADTFLEGLVNMEGPLAKLQGGAEKLSGTLAGQLSNLKDAVRVGFAKAADPLTEQLTKQIIPITGIVGTAVDQLGPPVFDLVGMLVTGLQKGLPIVAPLIALVISGLGKLLTAAGPALEGLGPLGGRIGDSLTRMFTELEPVMPDVVNLLIAMVGVLPDFVDLLTSLVPVVMPIVRLITVMLGFEPVRRTLSLLLIGLLAYRRVSGLVGGLQAFATVIGIIGNESEVAGVKAGIAYNKLFALGAIAAGGIGAAQGLPGAVSGKSSVGQKAAFVGNTTLAGAGIGTLIGGPGVGTAVGAGAGFVVGGTIAGLGALFPSGDPVVPGATMNRHLAAGGGAAGLRITSGQRGYGLRSSASGHLNGSAVDVAGSGLSSYAQRVRSTGGWAVEEGTGAGHHVHAAFGDPAGQGRRGAMPLGGDGLRPIYNYFTGAINGIDDLEAAVRLIQRKVERDDRERARTPVLGRTDR